MIKKEKSRKNVFGLVSKLGNLIKKGGSTTNTDNMDTSAGENDLPKKILIYIYQKIIKNKLKQMTMKKRKKKKMKMKKKPKKIYKKKKKIKMKIKIIFKLKKKIVIIKKIQIILIILIMNNLIMKLKIKKK